MTQEQAAEVAIREACKYRGFETVGICTLNSDGFGRFSSRVLARGKDGVWELTIEVSDQLVRELSKERT